MTSIDHRQDWRDDAACAQTGGEEWFPPGRGTINPLVLKTCAGCPVWRDCFLYALGRVDLWDGIWAGLTARDLAQFRDQVVTGEVGTEVIGQAREVVEHRDGATTYLTAAPHPIPGRSELRRDRRVLRVALVAAGLGARHQPAVDAPPVEAWAGGVSGYELTRLAISVGFLALAAHRAWRWRSRRQPRR